MRPRHVLAIAVLGIALPVFAGAADCPQPPVFTIQCDSLGAAGTPLVPGTNCRIVLVDGYPRDYVVYVPRSPSFKPQRANPLLLHFHGSGGSGQFTLTNSGWLENVEKAGIIAVFGSGLRYLERPEFGGEFKTHWNDAILPDIVDLGWKPPCYPPFAPWPADDVAFTSAMMDDVAALMAVDPRRVYGSGFSNGNGFVRRAMVDLAGRFAAAGGGGLASDALIPVAPPARQTSYYNTVGNRDNHTIDLINASDPTRPPVTDVPLTYAALFSSSFIQTAVGNLLDTYGLSHTPDKVWEFTDELRVEFRTPLNGNRDGNEYILSVQKGVIHEFPVASNNPEGFDDPDILWKFFKQHPETRR